MASLGLSSHWWPTIARIEVNPKVHAGGGGAARGRQGPPTEGEAAGRGTRSAAHAQRLVSPPRPPARCRGRGTRVATGGARPAVRERLLGDPADPRRARTPPRSLHAYEGRRGAIAVRSLPRVRPAGPVPCGGLRRRDRTGGLPTALSSCARCPNTGATRAGARTSPVSIISETRSSAWLAIVLGDSIAPRRLLVPGRAQVHGRPRARATQQQLGFADPDRVGPRTVCIHTWQYHSGHRQHPRRCTSSAAQRAVWICQKQSEVKLTPRREPGPSRHPEALLLTHSGTRSDRDLRLPYSPAPPTAR